MKQEVKMLHIKDLVLWTENPRDPINANAKDQDIVNRALEDKNAKWTLSKLAKSMGDYYDFSELPTVVYHGEKPVVYDGNRRMVLAKIKYELVKIKDSDKINIPFIPELIPCNVCDKEVALRNIVRKHSDSGSWDPLERDLFLHKFMGEKKSDFLVIEETTGLISKNPHLNQRFVKEEIFKEENLKNLGFEIKDDKIFSSHNNKEATKILTDVSQKIKTGEITTRKNRGKVIEVLDKTTQETIENNKKNTFKPITLDIEDKSKEEETKEKQQRQTKRTQKTETEIFGGKLYLEIGPVSDLYRDILDLYQFFLEKKVSLSPSFQSLIRMAMRLLAETAAKEKNTTLDKFIKSNFEAGKKALSQDLKTTLSNQNVTETSIIQLLHTGAHNYQSSNNMEQTIAVSLVIGSILTITHGRKN